MTSRTGTTLLACASRATRLRCTRSPQKNRTITGTMYNVHTTACRTVVWGDRLIVPFSTVPYQLLGGTWAEMSNASESSPPSAPPS